MKSKKVNILIIYEKLYCQKNRSCIFLISHYSTCVRLIFYSRTMDKKETVSVNAFGSGTIRDFSLKILIVIFFAL